jgi:hypothetical protein
LYNGNFDITRVLDQSNPSTQRCRLIFWVESSVGGYLVLAKTIIETFVRDVQTIQNFKIIEALGGKTALSY